jgi:putative peptidoglycan lipid II flippase
MMLISLPLTAFVVVLARPLVAFAFERGAFTAEAAALLASVLMIYALQFPLDAVVRVLLSSSYARLDTRTPFVNVAIGVALDVVLASLLFLFLGVRGIALAYVLASVGNLVHAYGSVRSRVRFSVRPVAGLIAKTAVASTIAGAIAALVLFLLPAASDLIGAALRLGVPGLAGLVACALSLLALGLRPSRLRAPDPPAPVDPRAGGP